MDKEPEGWGQKPEYKSKKQDVENLLFRRKHLERKMRRILLLLSGRTDRVTPLVRGEDDEWAEERGRALIEDLTQALEDYQIVEKKEALTDQQRELFQCFLYCVLRNIEQPYTIAYRPTLADWQWLIDQADGLAQYRDRYTLYYHECYPPLALPDVWDDLDCLYLLLTGQAVRDMIPSEERETMEKLFAEDIREYNAEMEFYEQYSEDSKAADEPEEAACEDEGVDEAERAEDISRIGYPKQRFKETTVFCQTYLRFRELFFALKDWQVLKEWTENAVDLYLYRRGESSFLSNGVFFRAYGMLDRTVEQLSKTMNERR